MLKVNSISVRKLSARLLHSRDTVYIHRVLCNMYIIWVYALLVRRLEVCFLFSHFPTFIYLQHCELLVGPSRCFFFTIKCYLGQTNRNKCFRSNCVYAFCDFTWYFTSDSPPERFNCLKVSTYSTGYRWIRRRRSRFYEHIISSLRVPRKNRIITIAFYRKRVHDNDGTR